MTSKEKLEVVTKKNTITGRRILKFVAIMTVVKTVIKLISKHHKKKAKNTDLPEGEYCYHLKLDGKQIELENHDVRKITLNAKMSGVDLNLSNIKEMNGLKIICKGLMSGICIRVPENIVVKVALKTRLAVVANSVPNYLTQNLPTIYISGKVYFSGVNIRLVQD